MIKPYTAVGLVPTVRGIRRRADIRVNLEHLEHLAKAAAWLSSLDLPVRLIAIPEGALLTGPLEPTNQWYAIAKIAGLMTGQAYRRQYGCDFISVMPTNLYGPGDNFDLMQSHVVPAPPTVNRIFCDLMSRCTSPCAWANSRAARTLLDDLGYEHVTTTSNALVQAIINHIRMKQNGVAVNQTRIDNPYLLANGDRISISSCVIEFVEDKKHAR